MDQYSEWAFFRLYPQSLLIQPLSFIVPRRVSDILRLNIMHFLDLKRILRVFAHFFLHILSSRLNNLSLNCFQFPVRSVPSGFISTDERTNPCCITSWMASWTGCGAGSASAPSRWAFGNPIVKKPSGRASCFRSTVCDLEARAIERTFRQSEADHLRSQQRHEVQVSFTGWCSPPAHRNSGDACWGQHANCPGFSGEFVCLFLWI